MAYTVKMKSQEMFVGFDAEQQARHEQYLINRFGEKIQAEGWGQSSAFCICD